MSPLEHQQLQSELSHLLTAGLAKIEHCVAQVSNEQVWWRPGATENSVGNLVLHLAGNLRQWAVVSFNAENDDRNRASEFDARDGQSKDELLKSLRDTVRSALLSIEQLPADCWCNSLQVQGFQTTVLGALMHTTSHFVGHTHQIVQLCRMQLGEQYQFMWHPEGERDSIPV